MQFRVLGPHIDPLLRLQCFWEDDHHGNAQLRSSDFQCRGSAAITKVSRGAERAPEVPPPICSGPCGGLGMSRTCQPIPAQEQRLWEWLILQHASVDTYGWHLYRVDSGVSSNIGKAHSGKVYSCHSKLTSMVCVCVSAFVCAHMYAYKYLYLLVYVYDFAAFQKKNPDKSTGAHMFLTQPLPCEQLGPISR